MKNLLHFEQLRKMKISQKLKKLCLEAASSSTLHAFPNIVQNNGIFSKLMWSVGFIVSLAFFVNMSISIANDYLRFDFILTQRLKTELTSFVLPTVILCSKDYDNLYLKSFLTGCKINNDPCNYTHFEVIEMYDPVWNYFANCDKFIGLKAGSQEISKLGYGTGIKLQFFLAFDGEEFDEVLIYITEPGIRAFYENSDIIGEGGTKINVELQIESEKKLGYPYR